MRLIAAQFLKPFVKSNKNEFLDAEVIAEAVERKNMRFVPIKTDDQLDLQAVHRVRDQLIARRVAVINQIRAFLLERGMTFAKTPAKLRIAMPDILENAEANLTPQMRSLIDLLWSEWKLIEQQIEVLSDELERIASTDAGCIRIRQIPGIGPIVATAIVAAIGNGAAFRKGREFAAWLGLVPKQHSTGRKARLLGIGKRGNTYLRKIVVHGARAAVLRIERDRSAIGGWMDRLESRAPHNMLILAMAKQARANRLGRVVERSRLPRSSDISTSIRQAWKRRLRLGKQKAAFHFPTLRRRSKFLSRSARDSNRRQNSHNDVPKTCNRE